MTTATRRSAGSASDDLKRLGCELRSRSGHACDVSAGPGKTADQAGFHGRTCDDHNRGCASGSHRRLCRRRLDREDSVHLCAYEFFRLSRQRVQVSVGRTKFQLDVLPGNITCAAETLCEVAPIRLRIGKNRDGDRRDARPLSVRRNRPRRRHAAEQRDELAALHSITSSARARMIEGISIPRDFAVFRLTANSTLTDC
jgi:hypothetical protein